MLAATILFIATNAGLIGISRLSWSLSEHRQLPSVFSALHPNYRTPAFTIIFYSVIAADPADPGPDRPARQPLLVRGDAVVHARPCLDRVAAGQAARPRPARTARRGTCASVAPTSRSARASARWARSRRGVSVVIAAPRGAHRRPAVDALGLVVFVVYRRRQGLDLTSPARSIAASARPTSWRSNTARRSSRSSPTSSTPRSCSAPSRLVGEGGVVDVLYLIAFPASCRSTPAWRRGAGGARAAGGGRAHRRAATASRRARRSCARVTRAARSSRRRNAPTPRSSTSAPRHAPQSEGVLGPTARYLLAERPCRVIVATQANGDGANGGGNGAASR